MILPAAALAGEGVTFPGADGFQIAATLYAPSAPTPVAGVVIFPGLGETRERYDGLARKFAEAGVCALAVDLRGHGGSTRQGGAERPHKSFAPKEWTGLAHDAVAAVRWLRARPGVDRERVALVGASIGGTAAFAAAGEDRHIRALALISPALDLRGLTLLASLDDYGARPLLLLHGGDADADGRQAVQALRARRADAVVRALTDGGQGAAILERRPEAAAAVVRFLLSHLAAGK